MPSDKKLLGAFGEDVVCRWMKRRGYKIAERNFSCRLGEVDIIARQGAYIVFVEVKLRKNAEYGEAREFVTPAKQRRVILAAELWLAKNRTDLQPRFDVAEVYAPQGLETKRPEVNYIKDAFEL